MSISKDIRLLCTEQDRTALQGILEQLRAKGIRISDADGSTGKKDTVLAVLSEAFYADREKTDQLLSLVGAGAENVLPLQLDTVKIPDTVKSALYARNIIPASGRDAAQIAERIVAALPKKKSRLPGILIAAAAVLLLLAGFYVWNGNKVTVPDPTPEPTPEETPAPIELPMGLTEEDLAEVRCVVIIGEHFEHYAQEDKRPRDDMSSQWRDMLFDLGSSQQREDTDEFDWYWNEDGTQVSMSSYDLEFLSLLPNLEELHMAMVRVTKAPDLSALEHLSVVWAFECELGDLTWLARSGASKMQIRAHADYAPLGTSNALKVAILDSYRDTPTDFSVFSPPKLQEFDLSCRNVNEIDLSGLAACSGLSKVRLNSVPIHDLSFLAGKSLLREIQLNGVDELRDISAIRGLSRLSSLRISPVDRIADLSPIGDCSSLNTLVLDTHQGRIRDVSYLNGMKSLQQIQLNGVDLQDLDFLEGIAREDKRVFLALGGNCADWSGLGAVKEYRYLELSPWDRVSLNDILPALEGVTVQNLTLRQFSDVDLSALPKISGNLELDRCDIEDLSTMPEDWYSSGISLNKCSRLRSLDGLQNQNRFGRGLGSGDLNIYNCPRLTDWSALDGMKLSSLSITGSYTLPSFDNLQFGSLRLDSIAELEDLEFLNGLNEAYPYNFTLVGLDGVKSLEPLKRLHGGYLAVSPQLAEQAEDLVKAGNFREFRVEYPEGGWDMDNMEISLLSLDELETLPKALLRRVNRVCVVGDRLIDLENFDIWEDWGHMDKYGGPALTVVNRSSGEQTPVGKGFIEDLSMFSELTGLRELHLYEQPISSLDGIQNFQDLQHLALRWCPKLTDASPAFACQQIRHLSLDGGPLESIQGLQNLDSLTDLNISSTKVSDLSPLSELDYGAALAERGGFQAFLNNLPVADYSALASIPVLDKLDLNETDAALYVPYLENTEIRSFTAADSFTNRSAAKDPNALFADFIHAHPGLTELWIPYNDGIQDLTPVLELEDLRILRVSKNMQAALASLQGQSYGFELEITD